MSVVSGWNGSAATLLSSQRFDPWGKVVAGGVPQTRKNYTGQELDTTGLLDYHARYYDPTIARFISADSVVPGSASGGMDGVALKGLTVDFHEPGFVGQLTLENNGGASRLDTLGPQNPQALNRYAYVLNNPLRWKDANGHAVSDPNDGGGKSPPVETTKKPKQPSKSNPYRGTPGSTSTTYQEDGTPKQVRKYGPDGYPEHDDDYDHDHEQGRPHRHPWGRPEDGSPPRDKDRGLGQPIPSSISGDDSSSFSSFPAIPAPNINDSATQTAVVGGSAVVIVIVVIVLLPIGL